MTTKSKSIYNIMSGVFGQVAIAAVGLLIPRLILVNFGSEINGLLNSVTHIFQYVGLLEAGVGVTTMQSLYKSLVRDDRAATNAYLSATNHYYRRAGVVYLAAVLIFAVLYPRLIVSGIPMSTVFWIIFFMGLSGAVNFFLSAKCKLLLEADGKKYIILNITTIITLISNITKVLLLWYGLDIVVVQGYYCFMGIAQAFLIGYYVRRDYPWLNLKVKPDYTAISQKYSALVHQISGLVCGSTDVILLTLFCDLKVVSIYTMYSMVMNLVSNLIGQIGNGFVYRLGQLYHSDRERFLKLNHIFEVVNLTAVFSCFTVAYIMIIPFIRLYTSGISDANYVDYRLPILFVMVQLLSNGRSVMGNVINYAGRFKDTQYRSIFESVINLAVSFMLVSRLGLYGVLIGTIVALLYRTNDIILYANHKILGISAWHTYRGWIVDFVVFIMIINVAAHHPIAIQTYWEFVKISMFWGVISSVVFTMVQIVVERRAIVAIYLTRRDSKHDEP